MFVSSHFGPLEGPGFLIIPVYLLALWSGLGVTVAFVYGLKKDNDKAKKGFSYSLLILVVFFFAYFVGHGVEHGRGFKL